MAKTKRQSASSQSPPPEPDIDQAFQLLFPCVRDRDPHRTAGKINQAIVEGDAGLWKREKDAANKPAVHVSRQSFSAFYIVVAVEQPDGWHAEVQLRAGTFFGGDDPAKHTWIMSTKAINDLCEKENTPRHPGGSPRDYNYDDVRAAAFIALMQRLGAQMQDGGAGLGSKQEILLKTYSGNDLIGDVQVILGDGSPGETLLKDILNPLLTRIKNRLVGR